MLNSIQILLGGQACPTITGLGNLTHVACLTPAGVGEELSVVVSSSSSDSFTLQKAWSYAKPVVRKVCGCMSVAEVGVAVEGPSGATARNSTTGCPTTGGNELEIEGDNFGWAAATHISVSIGDELCKDVTVIVPHKKIGCVLPFGTGENVGVTVTAGEQSGTAHLLSYSPPMVGSVSGCATANGAATEDCPRAGGVVLSISGLNFGPEEVRSERRGEDARS